MVVNAADTNGDKEVDFDEFVGKVVNYTQTMFKLLDHDGDGLVQPGTNLNQTFSLKFFTTLLDEAFELFDANRDGSIAQEDLVWLQDSPALGFNADQFLLQLPAPLYSLYRQFGFDKDRVLVLAEVREVVRRTFAALDADRSCSTNLEEVDQLLERLGLRADLRVAISLLGHRYLTLATFLLQQLLTAADMDGDGAEVEELLTLGDFGLVEEMVRQVEAMGPPSHGTLDYLLGSSRSGRDSLVNYNFRF